MAASTTTPSTWTNSSDANFRAWGSAVAAKLLASGLVKTADTGQIDWTTVTAPAAVSTFQGYEIWRFNDALQATAPVYIKIQYGSGTSLAANPAMRFVFGSGSNGSGTLTGVLSSNLDVMATASAVAVTAYWSGSTNRFAMHVTGATSSTCMACSFERSVDSTGAVTSEAVLWVAKNGITASTSTGFSLAWDCTTGDKATGETKLGVLTPDTGPGTTGTQTAVYPVFHQKGVFMQPGMNWLAYFHAAITAFGAVSIPMYGASRTFMPLGSSAAFGTTQFRGGGTSCAVAMRYE